MIGFVVAMEKEAKALLDLIQIKEDVVLAQKRFCVGKLFNRDVVIVFAGIGKVNASLTTQMLIDKYNPTLIVNFGVAGGKENSNLVMGDMVLLDKICQYDFDLSEIDDVSIGYMQDYDTIYYDTHYHMYKGDAFKVRSGASGDRFTRNPMFLDIIRSLGAQVVDMEAGAIAQTCFTNDVPNISIKLISDVDGMEGSIFEQYSNNVYGLSEKFPTAIEELLNNI